MSKIGATPPKGPVTPSENATSPGTEVGKPRTEPRSDSFTTGAAAQSRSPAINTLAQQLHTAAPRLQFANADYAELARIFAGIISQNPGLERNERASRYARAILNRKRFKKLLGTMSEAEIGKLCDAIGDALSDSPVFGELIEEVSDGASKLGRDA